MEEKRFTLRMSADLFETVKSSAERNKRSVAKEIEFILSEHFQVLEKRAQSNK